MKDTRVIFFALIASLLYPLLVVLFSDMNSLSSLQMWTVLTPFYIYAVAILTAKLEREERRKGEDED